MIIKLQSVLMLLATVVWGLCHLNAKLLVATGFVLQMSGIPKSIPSNAMNPVPVGIPSVPGVNPHGISMPGITSPAGS